MRKYIIFKLSGRSHMQQQALMSANMARIANVTTLVGLAKLPPIPDAAHCVQDKDTVHVKIESVRLSKTSVILSPPCTRL